MKLAVALITVYLVWGSTYLAIAVANRSLPPLLMLSVRFLIAGALLYGWSLWRGDVAAERPGKRQWLAAGVVGGLLLVVDTGGVAWAQQRVASGIDRAPRRERPALHRRDRPRRLRDPARLRRGRRHRRPACSASDCSSARARTSTCSAPP